MHPRPPGRHIGIDGQPLILSFELKFFVCRHVSMWWFQNRVCLSVRLSVCPHPEKRYHPIFVNISPTLVIDTSMERSSRVLHHGNPKIWFKKKKSFKLNLTCILTCAEELKSFKKVSTCTYMSTSGMHRCPFEGRHLVFLMFLPSLCPLFYHYFRAIPTSSFLFF